MFNKQSKLNSRKLSITLGVILILFLILVFLNREIFFPFIFKGRQGANENTTTPQKEAGQFMVQPLSPGFR